MRKNISFSNHAIYGNIAQFIIVTNTLQPCIDFTFSNYKPKFYFMQHNRVKTIIFLISFIIYNLLCLSKTFIHYLYNISVIFWYFFLPSFTISHNKIQTIWRGLLDSFRFTDIYNYLNERQKQ